MPLRLRPARCLRGTIAVPGDKSISHRALILNALAAGEATVDGFLPSDDCLRSMACLRAYGVEYDHEGSRVRLRSPGRSALREPGGVLDCGNSGTTMRLLAGLAAGLDGLSVFDGDASLRRRPMDRVLDPLRAMGARVDGRAGGALPPIAVRGGALRPFRGRLAVASAQVKSAVLLAALGADGPSRLDEPAPTRDHTEIMLAAMGADVRRRGSTVELAPGGPLHSLDVQVPGDLSAAAFWLVAASLLPDAELQLPAVGVNPTRRGVLDVLLAMGADIELRNERTMNGEPVADLTVHSAPLRGTTIAGDLIPRVIDEIPVLAVAAARADGVTEIRDATELRVKESDRLAAVAGLLRALGAGVTERPDGLRIEGGSVLHGAALDAGGDHRMAMAAAVAALAAEGESQLRGDQAVTVSYPDFWQHLREVTAGAAFA